MRLAAFALVALVLVAACVGQTTAVPSDRATGEVGTSDIDDLGNELNEFGNDIEELSVPDVDLTVP